MDLNFLVDALQIFRSYVADLYDLASVNDFSVIDSGPHCLLLRAWLGLQ